MATRIDRNRLARARPLGDRLIVRKSKPQKQTAGGILLPDKSQVEELFGEVIAIGPGKRTEDGRLIPVDGVQIGDIVVFSRYAGSGMGDELDAKNDEHDYVCVSVSEVYCVLQE